ncbi:MAG TPA: MoaD/ThiS family protein [Candidatus Limnocylindria bacterium]|nr:MoaD/ThiS family protein [Candidatus Limnocylindria bacterium]
MKTLQIEVCFFAALRERLGERTMRAVPRGTTLAALWRALAAEAPGLERLPVRFAVRERYVEPSYVLRAGDSVAIFPPVSGGA